MTHPITEIIKQRYSSRAYAKTPLAPEQAGALASCAAAIRAGPYRYVRHPMYLGVILLLVLRTAKEDRMLREELPGYTEYTRHVGYRLVPGIW